MFEKSKNEKGKKLAFKAAEGGNKEKLIKVLAEYNLDINICDKDGDTLLQGAIVYDRTDVFDYLLSEEIGIKINVININGKNELYRAVEARSSYYVSELLKRNATVDVRTKRGETALVQASYKGDVDILRMLLDADADIETRDLHDDTALNNTAYYGHYDATKLLLEYGAEMGAKNKKGKTPQESAESQGYTSIVDLLKNPPEKKQEKIKRLVLLPEIGADQDNKPQVQWDVTDDLEIARVSHKIALFKTVTEIFNFKSQYLMTIIENNKTQVENVLKENFENIDEDSIEEAGVEYEKNTGEKIEPFKGQKQAHAWKNLNK